MQAFKGPAVIEIQILIYQLLGLSFFKLSKKPFQFLHLPLGDEDPCRWQGELNNTEE